MRVNSGGVGIEYEVTGDGRPLVLIHGFPDTGRLWRHQVPALADAGFQVIVPALRGYGRSDKPTAVGAYAMAALVGDVLSVMSDAGAPRAHVVGHDWGASIAWAIGALAPEAPGAMSGWTGRDTGCSSRRPARSTSCCSISCRIDGPGCARRPWGRAAPSGQDASDAGHGRPAERPHGRRAKRGP